MNIGPTIQRHTIGEVAEYFIPKARARNRHDELLIVLRCLWKGAEAVDIRSCMDCGFGFSVPFVAGDMTFYEIVYQGAQVYPKDRWEFRRTLEALSRIKLPSGTLALLEAGAGDGAFLRSLRRTPVGQRFRLTALEYDQGGLRQLKTMGVEALASSFIDLAQQLDQIGRFDCICFFQTLEHMDRIDETFAAIGRLGTPRMHVFISAPYRPSVEAEERAIGSSEMAPQHIGRWDLPVFEVVAKKHGFRIAEWDLEPRLARARDTWLLAVYRTNSRAGNPTTLEGRIQAISFRPVRGVLKRLVAFRWVPAMWGSAKTMLNHNQWIHLIRT